MYKRVFLISYLPIKVCFSIVVSIPVCSVHCLHACRGNIATSRGNPATATQDALHETPEFPLYLISLYQLKTKHSMCYVKGVLSEI